MAVVSHEFRVLYHDVPKVACTTLKTFFWEAAHGRPFAYSTADRALDRLRIRRREWFASIHHVPGYRTRSFARVEPPPEGYARICVVRDPAARLHSAWRSKVRTRIFRTRGESEDLYNAFVPVDPSFGDFVDHFEGYRTHSRAARVHTEPYAWHLGPDIAAFDAVFRQEELGRLASWLAERGRRSVAFPRRNESEPEDRDDRLSPSQVERLRELCQDDYRWLGGLYDPEAGPARFAAVASGAAAR
jgi:hypothetical protein